MDIFSPLVHTGWFNYKGLVLKHLEDNMVPLPENKVIEEKENVKKIEENNREKKSVSFSDMKI